MPTIIECPQCQRKLRVPTELADRDVQCPSCGHTFAGASAPPAFPAVPLMGAVELPSPLESPPVPEPGPRFHPAPEQPAGGQPVPRYGPPPGQGRCLACGEMIPGDAERCRYCGEAAPSADGRPGWQRGYLRRDCEPHRAGTVLALGIIGLCLSLTCMGGFVGLPLSVVAWVLGQTDLRKMREGEMDPEGQSSTSAGMVCGIIGTIFGCLCPGLTVISMLAH